MHAIGAGHVYVEPVVDWRRQWVDLRQKVLRSIPAVQKGVGAALCVGVERRSDCWEVEGVTWGDVDHVEHVVVELRPLADLVKLGDALVVDDVVVFEHECPWNIGIYDHLSCSNV